ncbi:MAG TPA: hypothetical protein PKC19_22550, partial [Roseiflexaceae bacterium]|nr:hypothetical protein [Roseiflexaceae bacterium]
MKPWRRRGKPRIFWLILASFASVIGIGFCGMLLFAGLLLARIMPDGMATGAYDDWQAMIDGYAAVLADYYVANDASWQGVETRLNAP